MAIGATLDKLFCSYTVFVTSLGARSLLFLAIATVASAISFALCIPIPFFINHLKVILSAAIFHLSCVANYIYRYRNVEPQEQQPQQVSYPYLRTFSKSALPVAALAFFTALDDPLKSIPSIYVTAICICSYLHVLVLLAILRRNEDFGVSDGCLAAAYGLLYSMYESKLIRFFLITGAIGFTGMRNLQFQNPPNPILAPLNSVKVDPKTKKQKKQEAKERKKETRISQPQVVEGTHRRRGTSI